jgi:hypothetical protein
LRASYLEIYNEEIRDLLSKDPKKKLQLHEKPSTGVYVKQLSIHVIKDVSAINQLLELGIKNRATGSTKMNNVSSRSHSVFQLSIDIMENEGKRVKVGKLNMVDLAGSERLSKTESTSQRLKEAMKINLSLSTLCHVISALTKQKDGDGHVPYRDSTLTRLLQDSLGGNTKTLMISTIGPSAENYNETLSTLRYANRAKNIKNRPRVNENKRDELL